VKVGRGEEASAGRGKQKAGKRSGESEW
jgi:hypothetical protein